MACGAEDLVELGLERVTSVAARLNLNRTDAKVLTVAGTNGKGSSVAFAEAILIDLGVDVGAYTSPHILRFNERIRINGSPVADDEIFLALEIIKNAIQETSLTYFELATILALQIFKVGGVNVLLLEVGLGGRLDAVNILDSDVALITSIDLDHQQWLGSDREQIGIEKAGILRPHRPAVIADPAPPKSITSLNPSTRVFLYGNEWNFTVNETNNAQIELEIQTLFDDVERYRFPSPEGILPVNASASIQALSLLGFKVSEARLSEIAEKFQLIGRLQTISIRGGEVLLDVAHNPAAVTILRKHLEYVSPVPGKNFAIFAALKDKDIAEMIRIMRGVFSTWFVTDLTGVRRASSSADLQGMIENLIREEVTRCSVIKEAWDRAWKLMIPGDRLVVFGSFYTIAAVLPLIKSASNGSRSGEFS